MSADTPVWLRALGSFVNAALALDPEAGEILQPVAGRRLGVEVIGPGLRFLAVPQHGRIELSNWPDDVVPDVSLRGAPASLVALMVQGADADVLRTGAVSVDGDAGTLRSLADAVSRLDIDPEEWLAGRVGDVMAHQVGNAARESARWAQRSAADFTEDLRDWLVAETGQLVEPEAAARFHRDVDAIRDDVERLEQRVERLVRARSR